MRRQLVLGQKFITGWCSRKKLMAASLLCFFVSTLFLGIALTPLSSLLFDATSPVEPPLPRHTHKVRGPLRVFIESEEKGAFETGTPRRLVASIQALRPLESVDFQWELPPGIQLISGEQSGRLSLERNQIQKFAILVETQIDENLQIHFSAKSSQNALQFAEAAQFNTHEQEWIEEETKSLLKRTKADHAAQLEE